MLSFYGKYQSLTYSRYTDFLVNEILPSGQIVHLDTYRAPKYGNKQEPSVQAEPKSPEVRDNGDHSISEPTPSAVTEPEMTSEPGE